MYVDSIMMVTDIYIKSHTYVHKMFPIRYTVVKKTSIYSSIIFSVLLVIPVTRALSRVLVHVIVTSIPLERILPVQWCVCNFD